MKDCEHLLEEIADRQKEILSVLVFFKIVVIVLLSVGGLFFLIDLGFWVFVFSSLSAVLR